MISKIIVKAVFCLVLIGAVLGVAACAEFEKAQDDVSKELLDTPNYQNREKYMSGGPNKKFEKVPSYIEYDK